MVRKNEKTAEVQQMENEHVLLLKQHKHKLLLHKRKLEEEFGSANAKKSKEVRCSESTKKGKKACYRARRVCRLPQIIAGRAEG